MKKTWIKTIVFLCVIALCLSVLVACGNEGGETEAQVQMKESYAQGRTAFSTITGFTLPELADCELLESSDLRVDQHTVACFDISGTAEDMAAIVAALQPQVGHEPTRSDEMGTSWVIEVVIGDATYVGDIWAMLDTEGQTSAVYVNYCVSAVAQSYLTGREGFRAVTGVTLPLFGEVEAEDYPYTAGDKSYCFDLTDGDGLTKYVFDSILEYLDGALSNWTKTGPSVDGEYTNVNYNSDAGWIGLTWDETNQAVYVNANMN